ncbi:MAG: transposase [Bdellovibrio sp.]|nr:transposase [Bdellovibrio sp.]
MNGVRLHFIDPGKPQQNGYIESLNGKFRAECLDRNLFDNLEVARVLSLKWKKEYETYRPHSSLNGLTPSEYAKKKGSLTQASSELKTG